ncbi:MAG TPA: hypothetical protein DDY12_03780 [Porphyromonadaceae bacterium]|nr:hypothetical protein [Porphyromonadaceae bacterium]
MEAGFNITLHDDIIMDAAATAIMTVQFGFVLLMEYRLPISSRDVFSDDKIIQYRCAFLKYVSELYKSALEPSLCGYEAS